MQYAPPTNKPLIMMTHVCRSWRNVLLSTPSLWTQINFSLSGTRSQQAEVFLRRSGNQLLDIYQSLGQDRVEPFLSITLHNLFRLQGLSIISYMPHFEPLLRNFSASAPELKHLEIQNHNTMESDKELPKIFGGRMPKLTSLSLYWFRTNLRNLDLPSLMWFKFETGKDTSIQDLISFFERCPLLEFIQLCFCSFQTPVPPPHKRVCLAALREFRLNNAAYITGLLDHLILPRCTEMMLQGTFADGPYIQHGTPAARIHPSSIEHLPVTRGITKAIVMEGSCTFSGPSGNLSFGWLGGTCEGINNHFFTSFSPISVLQVRELWVGQRTTYGSSNNRTPSKQTAAGLRGAFEVLTGVEGLTIACCRMEPFLQALGETADGGILLPGLQKLAVYVWCGDMDVSALIQCTRTRKEHFRPLEEVTVVWEKDPGARVRDKVESLREFVGELVHHVGKAPKLFWSSYERD